MCQDPCSELPDDLSELARMAGDITWPEQVRNRALEKLLPDVSAIAVQVATRFPPRFRHDLVAQAGAAIWRRLPKFDPPKGRFESWCWTVLYNYDVDQLRKASAGPVLSPKGGDGDDRLKRTPAPAAGSETQNVWEDLRELRQTLDRIRPPLATTRGVNYFAVLLLQLRCALAKFLGAHGAGGEPALNASLAELVVECLQWRPEEDAACIKPGWPILKAMWAMLSAELCRAAQRLDAPLLCRIVQPSLPEPARLTPDVWNHWVNRAKGEARRRLNDEELWTRLFSRLLPDR